MRPIKYYSVILGESFQEMSYISTLSIVDHNPGIDYTLVFLNTKPNQAYKDLASKGLIKICLDTLSKYDPPESRIIYQVFWYRYVKVPDILGGGLMCQLDTDLICVHPFPDNEIVETRFNVCVDGSIENNGSMLKTLSDRNWWVPSLNRYVYFNAGLIAWDHDVYGWVFDEFDRNVREDASVGKYDLAPLGDQVYLNAIINNSGRAEEILNLLPSKWNTGVWTKGMSENVSNLSEMKKIVNAHVFSTAGKDRRDIMEFLYKEYSEGLG